MFHILTDLLVLKFPGCHISILMFSYLSQFILIVLEYQSLCRVKEELIDSLLRVVEVGQDARMRGGDEDRGRAPHPPASAETGNCHNKWITWPDETISSTIIMYSFPALPGISVSRNFFRLQLDTIKCKQRLNGPVVYIIGKQSLTCL